MSDERPRILVVGDAVAPTGFARVLHSILERLTEHYEFHHVGLNYYGDPHDFPWRIYPAGAEGDPQGTNRLPGLVRRVRPHLVFLLNDLWILVNYLRALRDVREAPEVPESARPLPIVGYTPVDAGPIESSLMRELDGFDRLYAYTLYGQGQLETSIAAVLQEHPDFTPRTVEVIPHGVDTDRFYPLGEDRAASRRQARRLLFPENPELHEGFLVLNANRNQPRKRIDLTLKGFALFAQDKPENVKLYLHMGTEDLGWNVKALARRYGMEDRLILTADENHVPGVSDEVLNRIFNACDVGINTSVGEGWGLVSCEHAAAGAAQVVPRHSACAEIWEGAAEMMEPAYTLVMERILTEGKVVTPEAVAAALEALYADPDHLRRTSEASYRAATRETYRWENVAAQWHQVFRKVLQS